MGRLGSESPRWWSGLIRCGFMISFILELLQHLDGLLDAFEAGLAAQHFQRFKQAAARFSARRQRREWAGTSALL